ncbi:MAG TPA: hypothetical protein DIU00_21900 [Phycisphaerales bacterium]|nr:hypothetical protein [Phycisphaerales bacterium]
MFGESRDRRRNRRKSSKEAIQHIARRFEMFRYPEFTAIGLQTGSGQIRMVEVRQYNIAIIAA